MKKPQEAKWITYCDDKRSFVMHVENHVDARCDLMYGHLYLSSGLSGRMVKPEKSLCGVKSVQTRLYL